jgi:hypothetical protein
MTPLGPKKPKKKPKPRPVKFMGEDWGFLNENDILEVGTSIYVCTDEDKPDFDLLETGTYYLENGNELKTIDGVISEIL